MRKLIIGCCLTTVGAFSNVAFFICASFYVSSISGWSNPPGKFLTAVENTGLSVLIVPIIIATILLILGLYFLLEEYLRGLIKSNDKVEEEK